MEAKQEASQESKKTLWQKVKSTVSSENISKGWKITRNIAGVVYILGTFVVSSACPVLLPVMVVKWIGAINLAAGLIAGVAQLDTSKKIHT